jgi:hypothetical protein
MSGYDSVVLAFFVGWTILAGWVIFLGGAEWAEGSWFGDIVLWAPFGVSADAPVTVIKVWVGLLWCGAVVLLLLL